MVKSYSDRTVEGFFIFILLALVTLTLYPLIHVTMASFSDPVQLSLHRGLIFYPIGTSLDGYKAVLENKLIISGLFNSMVLITLGVAANMFATVITAYILSRKKAMFIPGLSIYIVITMLFSGGMIPLYLTIKGVGLYNSLGAIIIPFAINTTYLIIMRTAFEGVPVSIEESAKIDGAGHIAVLFRIILPLVVPMMVVLILYYAVDRWNGWFWASVFLSDQKLYPLQLVLREILMNNDFQSMTFDVDNAKVQGLSEVIRYASIMIGTLPILAIYPFLQRYFVRGGLSGAVKE